MRWVLHLDMDAFYASVEQLARPTLRERPVLVGGLGPRAVVAAASYQARVFGARSAMAMAHARRLCPQAVVLPPRFALYHAVSDRVLDVLRAVSPVLEQVSLDEAFIEPPALAGSSPALVTQVCADLRAAVRETVGLPCSVGAGSGKQLAKIGSELAKPDGHLVIPHGTEPDVLGPLPVRRLWGIGPVAEARLRKIGVNTIGELAALDVRDAVGLLGDAVGTALHRLAHGDDDRPVATRTDVRSVSAETTFDVDVTDLTTLDAAVTAMASSAHRRLTSGDRAARTVTVKVRGADFALITRSESLPAATTDLATLVELARRLIRVAMPETAVRLIGVAYTGLTHEAQEALFGLEPHAGAPPGHSGSPSANADAEAPQVADSAAGGPQAAGHSGSSSVNADAEAPQVADTAAEAVADGGPGLGGWRPGDDVAHAVHGHGWVQGAGHGRVTVRFETRSTGPGSARTFAATDPALTRADPLCSLD